MPAKLIKIYKKGDKWMVVDSDDLGGGASNNLGVYATSAELIAAHPSPEDGSYATVIATGTVWFWNGLAWTDSGETIGNMDKTIYDPTNVEGDTFDMDNMNEGNTNKILTEAERIKLEGLGEGADVVGPTGAVDNNIAVFDGNTGKLIKDGGNTISQLKTFTSTKDDLFDTTINDAINTIGISGRILYLNDTGNTALAGTVVHLKGAGELGGTLYPTFDLADASMWEKTQGTITILETTVANGKLGYATRTPRRIKGVDTSAFTPGSQLWLSATTPGALTDEQPAFPNYSISVGGNFDQTVNGELIVSITKDVYDIFNDGWDGTIKETFDFRITSDGTTVTGTLTNPNINNDNLTCIFGTGLYTFELPTKGEIILTSGSATVPQTNYIYIPIETKVLTVSTSGFPTTEHCKIAKVALLSASRTQTDGALRNQNINDHIKKDSNNGHILHIAERVRQLNAEWEDGAAASLTTDQTNVTIANTAGRVWQMHLQDFPIIDMATGGDIHIVNDPVTPYRNTTNLNDVSVYSDGQQWNNKWTNIVVWGVANKTGETSHLMANLSSDGYSSEEDAIDDANGYTDYSIPKIFKGVGFLMGRFTIRRSSSNYTYNSGTGYLDLRGFVPNNVAGGGGGGSGITEWTSLTDTPSVYVANTFSTVNALGTALELTKATPSGVVVGNTDTQTLTNKTIDYNSNTILNLPSSGGGGGAIIDYEDNNIQSVRTIINKPVGQTISATALRITLETIPTGADFQVELLKNGVSEGIISILTTDTLTNGLYQKELTTFTSGSYTSSDVLTLDVAQIGSNVAGANLTALLV